MMNPIAPNTRGNRKPALRNRAIALVLMAAATFSLLSVWDRGECVRTKQGVFAGVADPVALRHAGYPLEPARAVAMTPTKPLLSDTEQGREKSGKRAVDNEQLGIAKPQAAVHSSFSIHHSFFSFAPFSHSLRTQPTFAMLKGEHLSGVSPSVCQGG